jgi:rod shape-determining protein MreC
VTQTPVQRLRGPLAVLGLIFVAWLLLPSAARLFTREAFTEFQAPALGLTSRSRELVRYWELTSQGSEDLAAAGRDLARAQAGMELRLRQLESTVDENRRLRAMLATPASTEFRTVVARVAVRESSAWWSRLTIRRGRTDGIRPGCPVVFGDCVVGRIAAVHVDTSEVELVTSPGFRCTAFLGNGEDQRPVLISGEPDLPFTAPSARVTYIPTDFTPAAGQPTKVITTGLGGLYPKGLRLGTLAPELEETPAGAYRIGTLRPSRELLSLREVSVLVPTEPQPYEELR